MLEMINWQTLNSEQKKLSLRRPAFAVNEKVKQQVDKIIASVRNEGDIAVKKCTLDFDNVNVENLRVSSGEFDLANKQISTQEKKSIEFAYKQILEFHETQRYRSVITEISPGVKCSRESRPLQRVGLYVPGGEVPLPSTVLMLGIPALIAGCNEKVICTPPRKDGTVSPHSLIAAQLCGIQEIYKIGGAQAIAAMSYGTESVKKVDKIFGPGSTWVTAAKFSVMNDLEGVNCDMPAGPSELLIIADKFANAEFIAADLLSQAEHSQDAQVFLITDDEALAKQVQTRLFMQLKELSRQSIIAEALKSAKIFIVEDLNTAFEISNDYAPEHLSLQIKNPDLWLSKINHSGAVFIGEWTSQTLGDYVMGTNHVLPTYGFSKVYSGLGVNDFMKFISFQQVTMQGIREIGPHAMTLANIEQLDAHKNAIAIRLRELS